MTQRKINLITLGDGAVGKTSLLNMFAKKTFSESHMVTLGLDFVPYKYKMATG